MEVVWEWPFRGASVGGVVSIPGREVPWFPDSPKVVVSERSWDEKCVSPVKVRGSLDPVDRGNFRSGLHQNGFKAEDREGHEKEIRRTLKDL